MQQSFYLGADLTLCLCPFQCGFLNHLHAELQSRPSSALGQGPLGFYPVSSTHREVLNKAGASFYCIFLWKWKKYCCSTPPVSKRELKEEEMSEKTLGQSLLPQKSPWPKVRAQAEEKTLPKAITATLPSELFPPSWTAMWLLHLSDH